MAPATAPLPTPVKQRYTKLKKVGEGTFASVFLAKNIDTGEKVAIKKIKIAGGGSASGKDGLDPTALREVGFLREMKCQNIIAVRIPPYIIMFARRADFALYPLPFCSYWTSFPRVQQTPL